MTAPTPPHPVLDPYYSSPGDRQSFVAGLFDGAARHYNRLGAMLDLGSGRWYRRQAQEALRILVRLRKHANPYVRAAAEEAIGKASGVRFL